MAARLRKSLLSLSFQSSWGGSTDHSAVSSLEEITNGQKTPAGLIDLSHQVVFNSLHAFWLNTSPFLCLANYWSHCVPASFKAHAELRSGGHTQAGLKTLGHSAKLWVVPLMRAVMHYPLITWSPSLSKHGFLSDVPIICLQVTETWQRCLEAKKQGISALNMIGILKGTCTHSCASWHAWAALNCRDRTSLRVGDQTSTLEIRMGRGGEPASWLRGIDTWGYRSFLQASGTMLSSPPARHNSGCLPLLLAGSTSLSRYFFSKIIFIKILISESASREFSSSCSTAKDTF